MPDHANYAAAVVIRAQAFDNALLSAWRSGRIDHSFFKLIQEQPAPTGSVDFFFQAPRTRFVANNRTDAILRINGWGTISVRLSPSFPSPTETRLVQWQADLRITPTVTPIGSVVVLSADKSAYRLLNWQFDVLSGTPFSAAAQSYLKGDSFKALLQTWLQDAIHDISLPILDFSLLGPFAGVSFSSLDVQCVPGALVLGFNVSTSDFSSSGDPAQLEDFAGSQDVAVAVHPAALKALMPTAEHMVQDELDHHGATLERFDVTCEEGRFHISGRASKTGGVAHFSLHALPRMTFTQLGKRIPLKKQTMVVRARTWPALSFVPADPRVDINRSDWLVVLEAVGGVVTLGVLPFAVEMILGQVVQNITGTIASANLNTNGVTPLVRRGGDPPTRVGIEQFEIHPSGLSIGVSSRLEAPPPTLSGVRSIPRNFVSRQIRYEVRLPFDVLETDPALRIRWSVIDLDSGTVLFNEDDIAFGRRRFEFVPLILGSQVDRFAVVCRVYRALGPFATELLNETIRLDVGPHLPQGAFVRWRYDVKNPQIRFERGDWFYRGDFVVRRWSKLHRTDKPCRHANRRSRFVYATEVFDDLPFPVNDLDGNRSRLCDYCFFGGPGSTIAAL